MSFKELENEIQDTVNKISLTAAVIVFLTWSLIGILRSNVVNRVTLHFQIIIAFIDILRHLSNYFLKVDNEALCEIVGALSNTSDHIYVAFNTLLAINAHLIFVLRQRPKMSFYPLYTYAAVMYIGIINYSYYSVLYCGYVVFLVMFKFNKRMSKLRIIRNAEYRNLDDESCKPVDHVGKLYWRVSMYPISCFITLFPHLVGMLIYDFYGKPPTWYYFFYRFCSRLPGTTNFFFMLCDPNFQLALGEFFNYIRHIFIKKIKDDKTYELDEHTQSNQTREQPSQDRFGGDEDWNIEFDDGYRMTVQDHIKYL